MTVLTERNLRLVYQPMRQEESLIYPPHINYYIV